MTAVMPLSSMSRTNGKAISSPLSREDQDDDNWKYRSPAVTDERVATLIAAAQYIRETRKDS